MTGNTLKDDRKRQLKTLFAAALAKERVVQFFRKLWSLFSWFVVLPAMVFVYAIKPRFCKACGARHDPPWGMKFHERCESCGNDILRRHGRHPLMKGLTVDEVELSEFFGTSPRRQDSRDRELLGRSIFEITRGQSRLFVQFSSIYGNVDLYVTSVETGAALFELHLNEIEELRVRTEQKRLLVMKRQRGANGDGSDFLVEAASISIDPISIVAGRT